VTLKRRFWNSLKTRRKPNVDAGFSPNTTGKSTKDFEVDQKKNRRIVSATAIALFLELADLAAGKSSDIALLRIV